MPRLAGAAFGEADAADDGLLVAHWRLPDGATLRLEANLSDRENTRMRSTPSGTRIWGEAISGPLPPWWVSWHLDAR